MEKKGAVMRSWATGSVVAGFDAALARREIKSDTVPIGDARGFACLQFNPRVLSAPRSGLRGAIPPPLG